MYVLLLFYHVRWLYSGLGGDVKDNVFSKSLFVVPVESNSF